VWYIFSLGFSVSIYDTLRRVSFVYFQENFLANACASFSIFIGFFLMMSTNYYVFGAISINRLYFFLIIAYTLGSFTFLALAKNKIKRILQLPKNGDRILFLELLKKHANYAFWLVLGIILFWTYTQGIYFISEKHIAIEDFNAVRISQNLVGVLSVFILAFENIMLTKTAEVFREKKYLKLDSYIKGVIKKNLLPFVGLVLISALVIIIIFKTYYNNNVFYSEKAIYLAYFLMYQFVFGLSRIFVVALKAMDQTIHIFLNHFYTCIATILIGIYFLPKFSNGHVLAIVMLISQIIFSAGAFFSYKKVILKNIISQQ
jgi:O-antigen/teichoic acid export membrane protein